MASDLMIWSSNNSWPSCRGQWSVCGRPGVPWGAGRLPTANNYGSFWLFELKGLCGKLGACQSGGCSGCAGRAGGAATSGRGCYRPGGDWRWGSAELLLDSPAVAPLLPPPRCPSDLFEKEGEGGISLEARKYVHQIRVHVLVCLLTGRNQHDSHKKSHLVWLQTQRPELLAEFKHGVE